jgi:hypothetical protein
MSGMWDLPERIFKFIESGVVTEFATVSAAGVAIDTPTYYFPSDDLKTIDVSTGLVNPSKAERARRNPKVGMLMDGTTDEPVVAIRGHAAVRDSDFEGNARRYIAETGFKQFSPGLTWEQARTNVHYWTRIMIEVTPVRILWWDTPAAMDGPPHIWNALAGMTYPASDPAPPGRDSHGVWPTRLWQDVAKDAIEKGRVPNLTVCDPDGYPMPIRVRRFELKTDGFKLAMPPGVPWPMGGIGTLSFEGHMTFVGTAFRDGDLTAFKVERALPQSLAALSKKGVMNLDEDMRRMRMARLEEELRRRGKQIPSIPVEEPTPTRMAKLRALRIASGVPITGVRR